MRLVAAALPIFVPILTAYASTTPPSTAPSLVTPNADKTRPVVALVLSGGWHAWVCPYRCDQVP